MPILSSRQTALLVLLGCVLALAGALTAQFGFGLRPCVLCLYQRAPFIAAGIMSMAALWPSTPPRARLWLLAFCASTLALNAGIATFHVGVEQHWWAGTAACTPTAPVPTSLEDMMASLSAPPPARCDQIPWSLFGISMAGYNIAYSLGLAVLAALCVRRRLE